MPDDRIEIDAATAAALVAAQFPAWADLPVAAVEPPGWDNRSFRLGAGMKLRLPSAARYVAQVEKERRWLPVLARHLPVPVPTPIATGVPGPRYPYPWSVQSWLAGVPASVAPPADLVRFARDLAAFLQALQAIPAGDGPAAGAHSFHRGGALAVYDAEVRTCVAAHAGRIDAARAAAVWEAALAARWTGPPVWVHGDVAAGNLLVAGDRLAAVIDFGTCATGDPACDLVVTWTLFAGEARAAFRAAVAADPGTWARARGWALWKALLALAGGDAAAAAVVAAVLADRGPIGPPDFASPPPALRATPSE
jgi:aminoglycoside phosphotransferase (APT) family kinase protein